MAAVILLGHRASSEVINSSPLPGTAPVFTPNVLSPGTFLSWAHWMVGHPAGGQDMRIIIIELSLAFIKCSLCAWHILGHFIPITSQ